MIPIIFENNGPKSCYLSVKFACRIDKYRADERITMNYNHGLRP